MAPREGNKIVKHGVLDARLNVHGVKGLKVADLSICPDNVGCKYCILKLIPTHKLTESRQHLLDSSVDRREVRYAHRRGLGLLWARPGHACARVSRTTRDRWSLSFVRSAREGRAGKVHSSVTDYDIVHDCDSTSIPDFVSRGSYTTASPTAL